LWKFAEKVVPSSPVNINKLDALFKNIFKISKVGLGTRLFLGGGNVGHQPP
jgi:hypothetical protein